MYGSTIVKDRRLDDMAPIILSTLICSTMENPTFYNEIKQVINVVCQQLSINYPYLLESLTSIILCTDFNFKEYQIKCTIDE